MLKNISIKDFRNIDNIYIECSNNTHIFLGNNGQGKTNILEAIYTLSIGKVFRASSAYEAIKFEKQAFHIHAETDDNSLEIHSANFPKKQTRFLVNESKESFINFLGNFYAVMFSPKDLDLIKGSPGIRRDYLDSVLIRLDKHYAYEINIFEKILKHRNALLKKIQNRTSKIDEIEVWDKHFYEKSQPIWEKRFNLIQKIKEKLEDKYQLISSKKEHLSIIYEKKSDSENFLNDLKKRIERDIILGSTSIGPHRDDFQILLNKSNSSEFASQGEVRSIVLALKLLEVDLIEKEHDAKVTLLLDDVFSEIDLSRQKALLDLLKSRQGFITTTHLEENLERNTKKIFQVKDGHIS